MMRRLESAEAFAYVDDCLAPADRRAFEARLREEPELRRQVGLWESQNRAIRAAFGAVGSARAAIDLGGSSNENSPLWLASAIQSRRSAAARAPDEARSPLRAGPAIRAPSPAPSAVARAPRFVLGRRVLTIATLAAGLLVVGAPDGSTGSRSQLIDAGLAAYRAFAASEAPVEFQASDAATLTQWFARRIGRGIAVPGFSSGALTLLGGRVAPTTTTNAAFLVYENRRGERAGLLIEPLDAPAPSTPTLVEAGGVSLAAWSDASRALVAVGADPDEVALLARLVEESPAAR